MKRALWLVALVACTDSTVTMTPVIDLPANDSASAFPLDQLIVEVAHDGDTLDLSSAKFTKGQTPSVDGVPFADDIVVHLTGFVGSSEVAYGRSCSVAVASNARVPAPHLYFSRSVKFGQIATSLPELRVSGLAVTYHDGSGLFLGGADPNTNEAVGDVERFDPRTGDLSVLAQIAPRLGAIAAPVGVGTDAQIAVIGGIDPSTSSGAQFIELIEADQPETRRVQMFIDINMSRIGLTATALTDGRVIVIGGRPPPMGPSAGDVDEVSTENGTAVVHPVPVVLAHPRYGHTATRLGSDIGAAVLVAGGLDDSGLPVAEAELYQPLAEAFLSSFTPTMQTPRSQHQAVLLSDGSVLVLGGVDSNGQPVVTSIERFTVFPGAFVQQPLQPGIVIPAVDFTTTTLPDGRVLITGGRATPGGPPISPGPAFIATLDEMNGHVDIVPTDQLSQPRAGHQATLLCDGTVLISGGTTEQVSPERYNPPPDGRR